MICDTVMKKHLWPRCLPNKRSGGKCSRHSPALVV